MTATPALRIEYLLLSELSEKFLEANAKLHDIGAISQSIRRYGFRDPLAIDATLNGGRGGVAEGNGRLEALLWMHQQGQKPPAYIKLTESGDWAIPCIIGGDSITEAEGLAYSLDHNSLTMAGGAFTALDISRLYNPAEYQGILEGLAKKESLPVSVDGDDLDLLIAQMNKPGDGHPPQEEPPTMGPVGGKIPLAIVLDEDQAFEWNEIKEQLGCARDTAAFLELMERWQELCD